MSSNDLTQAATDGGIDLPPLPAADEVKTIGGYAIRRQLGAGAMGEVFLAEAEGRQVAIKLISSRYAGDEGFLARFEREISVLARLDHAHIAKAVNWGVEGERPWLAMEYIEGPNLADVLSERGTLCEADALRIAMQVGRGLAYVHSEAGLVHRDVKPGNILVARFGENVRPERVFGDGGGVKLIDFGLARSADDEAVRLTMTGMVMGTPYYMSPEQIRGEHDIDFRTDIYALGAMLFHLLTGRHPYPGSSPAVVMSGHLTSPLPDPASVKPGLDPAVCQLIATALQKRPQDRFGDWRALISASEKILRNRGELEPSTMRLVRRRSGETVQAAGNPTPGTMAVPRPQGSQAPTTKAPVPPAVRAVPPPPPQTAASSSARPVVVDAPGIGTDALRKAATTKFNRMRDSSASVPRQAAPAARQQDQGLRLDAASRLAGLAPYALLGIAVISLVVVIIWRPWE